MHTLTAGEGVVPLHTEKCLKAAQSLGLPVHVLTGAITLVVKMRPALDQEVI